MFEVGEVQRNINLVDLAKSFQTSIYLQKSASIQPRTSYLIFFNFPSLQGFNFHRPPAPLAWTSSLYADWAPLWYSSHRRSVSTSCIRMRMTLQRRQIVYVVPFGFDGSQFMQKRKHMKKGERVNLDREILAVYVREKLLRSIYLEVILCWWFNAR